MLDPTGPAPTDRPPEAFLDALRASGAATEAARAAGLSVERARADIALTVAFDKVALLREAEARYTADTADDAYRLMMAAQEAAQAMLSAFVSFRDRVAAA